MSGYKGNSGKNYAVKPVDYYDETDSGADKTFLSKSGQEAVDGYKKTWAEGDAEYKAAQAIGDTSGMAAAQKKMDDAHAGAEREREKAGYQGGANGGAYNLLAKPEETVPVSAAGAAPATGEFSYRSAPDYVDKYQALVDSLTKDVLNRKAFEYDPESDPAYQQYKESYTRNGQRAMEDTLGQVSARTGGLASSYAASAAQQTYDGYMGQLADKVPQLRQLAYQMYLDEENRDRANLELLRGLGQDDYNKYLTQLGQYNTDRNFDYGAFRDQVGDDQWKQSFDFQKDQEAYRREQDALERERYEREYTDQRNDKEREWQYQQDSGKAALLYTAGDPSGYAQLWGLTPEETQLLVDDYAEKKQLTRDEAARQLADYYAKYGDFPKAKEPGVDTSRMEGEYGGSAAFPGTGDGGDSGYDNGRLTDRESAVEYLRTQGVGEETLAGMMSEKEWNHDRAQYRKTGEGDEEVAAYDSYDEYINAYVKYALSEKDGK